MKYSVVLYAVRGVMRCSANRDSMTGATRGGKGWRLQTLCDAPADYATVTRMVRAGGGHAPRKPALLGSRRTMG